MISFNPRLGWQQDLLTVINQQPADERQCILTSAGTANICNQPSPKLWNTGKHLQRQRNSKSLSLWAALCSLLTIPMSRLLLYRSLHCLITYLGFYSQILALLVYISWVLDTDPSIAWLHILSSTPRSMHCLITYLGYYNMHREGLV